MDAITTKTFNSGNGVAVMLPCESGVGPDLTASIEQDGRTLHIRVPLPQSNPDEQRRKLHELIAALDALGPIGEVQDRKSIAIEFPDRPGLY